MREVVARGVAAHGELLEFWIEADMFLRHMNRVLVGTMLEVAPGRRAIEEFSELLAGRAALEAGRTAPAARAGARARRPSPRAERARAAARRSCRGRASPYPGMHVLNVLLTNDDGIEAEGLQTLRRALVALRACASR